MLPNGFKPMLAGKAELNMLRYPLLASPKFDGIRAIVDNGIVLSRNLKPIPNQYVQELFGQHRYNGLDGELVVGLPYGHGVFNRSTSGVMSYDGRPDVRWLVFDSWTNPHHPYMHLTNPCRSGQALEAVRGISDRVELVMQVPILNGMDLLQYEEKMVTAGYEGIMLRSLGGAYKFGRSTLNEHYLLKMKRFEDAEAVIMGFEEKMHNANEAKVNALGHTERSSHKENKVPMGTLGALNVRDTKTNVEFQIGTGFDDGLRAAIWERQRGLIGKVVKYKFQPVGVMEKPRFPVFIGFRDPKDMG